MWIEDVNIKFIFNSIVVVGNDIYVGNSFSDSVGFFRVKCLLYLV